MRKIEYGVYIAEYVALMSVRKFFNDKYIINYLDSLHLTEVCNRFKFSQGTFSPLCSCTLLTMAVVHSLLLHRHWSKHINILFKLIHGVSKQKGLPREFAAAHFVQTTLRNLPYN